MTERSHPLNVPSAASIWTGSVARVQEIADEVEAELKQAFPNAEIFIRQDPADEIRPASAL